MTQETPPNFAEAVYASLTDTSNWQAYAEVEDLLAQLKEYNIKIIIVSNIGWDIRPSFKRERIFKYVDQFILSCEEGVIKPQAEIFETACEDLKCDKAEILMVGDNPEADGGASEVGIATYILPQLTEETKTIGLKNILNLIGACETDKV